MRGEGGGGGRSLSPPPPGNQRIRFSFEFSFSIGEAWIPPRDQYEPDTGMRNYVRGFIWNKKICPRVRIINNEYSYDTFPILKIPFSNDRRIVTRDVLLRLLDILSQRIIELNFYLCILRKKKERRKEMVCIFGNSSPKKGNSISILSLSSLKGWIRMLESVMRCWDTGTLVIKGGIKWALTCAES